MNYYETIGVSNDATQDEIAKAYRKLAREKHPDAGGDKEEFAKLAEAYEVLSDPDKRAKYDATGECDASTAYIHQTIADLVHKLFVSERESIFGGPDANLIKSMCDLIASQRSQHERNRSNHKQHQANVEAKLERFRRSNESTKNVEARDFIVNLLETAIAGIAQQVALEDAEVKKGDALLVYLNDIRYEATMRNPYGFTSLEESHRMFDRIGG